MARAVARPSGGDDVGHPAQLTQRGADQLPAFLRVRRVRGQFVTHGFVAGLRLSSLRDLRLGIGELLQRAQLGDELLVVVSVIVLLMCIGSGFWVLTESACSRVGGSSFGFGESFTASLEPVRDSP